MIVCDVNQVVHLKMTLVVHHRFGTCGLHSRLVSVLSIESVNHLTMNPSAALNLSLVLNLPCMILLRLKRAIWITAICQTDFALVLSA